MSTDFYDEDEKEAVSEEVLNLLTKNSIDVENHIQSDIEVDVGNALGGLVIPIVLVYDASGELKKAFHNGDQEYGEDGFTYEKDVNAFVADLIKGSPNDSKKQTGNETPEEEEIERTDLDSSQL